MDEELIVNLTRQYHETAADVIEEDRYEEDKWCMMEGHIIQTDYNEYTNPIDGKNQR